MTLNFIGTNPLSRCVSDNASSIHLFIYPAIITNYHFFYRAFISKSYRRAYNFTSVLYDPTKPVLRKVLVNFSQVDFNRKFYKVFNHLIKLNINSKNMIFQNQSFQILQYLSHCYKIYNLLILKLSPQKLDYLLNYICIYIMDTIALKLHISWYY